MKKKTIKAWAVINQKELAGVFLSKEEAQGEMSLWGYEDDFIVPCTITYQLKDK